MHATEYPYPEEVLIGSKPHWLWPDGTLLPVVRGGDGSDDDNDDEEGEGGEPPKPDADGKFTQADLDRIAKKARREGNKSGKLKQAKDLGFETVEDMEAALAEHRSAKDAKKSEDDKAREKLLKDQQAAEEKSAKADR